jgi:hypothetical protein
MPERTCKVALQYAGRDVDVGERFDVEPKDVELLLTIGWIEPEDGEAGYVTAHMEAEDSSEYRTRDMQAVKRKPGRPRKGT